MNNETAQVIRNEPRRPNQSRRRHVDVGSGEPVILLSGLFESMSNWDAVAETLSKTHRVIIPRLPVFDLPPQDVNLDRLIFFLEEFISEQRLEKVTLIGNSLGGHLAILYTLWNPGKVRKLVLTGSLGLQDHTYYGQYPRLKNYDFVKEKIAEVFYNKALVTGERIDNVFNTVGRAGNGLRILGIVRSAQRNNLAELLDRVYIPTLLLWGLQDKITPPEVALQFHELIPKSEVKFLDQCGHVPMMEQPALFVKHLQDFLLKTSPQKAWN